VKRQPEVRGPFHQVGAGRPGDTSAWTLTVTGLVERPTRYPVNDVVSGFDAVTVHSNVNCPDGKIVGAGEWRGASLDALLERAGRRPEATHVLIGSGEFLVAFELRTLASRGAILAVEREGVPLTWEQGGPLRLIFAKGACFDTVKWVDTLRLEADGSGATALDVVRTRRSMRIAAGLIPAEPAR